MSESNTGLIRVVRLLVWLPGLVAAGLSAYGCRRWYVKGQQWVITWEMLGIVVDAVWLTVIVGVVAIIAAVAITRIQRRLTGKPVSVELHVALVLWVCVLLMLTFPFACRQAVYAGRDKKFASIDCERIYAECAAMASNTSDPELLIEGEPWDIPKAFPPSVSQIRASRLHIRGRTAVVQIFDGYKVECEGVVVYFDLPAADISAFASEHGLKSLDPVHPVFRYAFTDHEHLDEAMREDYLPLFDIEPASSRKRTSGESK